MHDEVLSSGRIRRTDVFFALNPALNHVGEPVFAPPTQVGPTTVSYCSLAVNDTSSGGSRVVHVPWEDQCSMAAHWVMEMSVATGECFPVCLSPPSHTSTPTAATTTFPLISMLTHSQALKQTFWNSPNTRGGLRHLRLRCRTLLRCV